jgi:hypothetical protein
MNAKNVSELPLAGSPVGDCTLARVSVSGRFLRGRGGSPAVPATSDAPPLSPCGVARPRPVELGCSSSRPGLIAGGAS